MLFATIQNVISEKLAQLLKQKGPFKVSITLQVELKKKVLIKTEKSFLNSHYPILTHPHLLLQMNFK